MKKIMRIFFALTLALTMMFSNLSTVSAWDSSIPHEFTQVKSIDYPWWWSSKIGSTKQWSTTMCTYNGNIAYCLEASKNTPISGSYVASVINNNSAVKKLLYYGYGGPGYDNEMRSIFEDQLNACVPDDFGTAHGNFDEGAYLFTHIWLSYAYSGDLMGLNLADFNAKWPNPDGNGGYGDNILWGYNVITSMPEPKDAMFNVNGNSVLSANLTATYDKENKVQKTETVTFNAGGDATTNITLQDNVTLHNVTTGTNQTGGTATVYGGQSFYLSAPLKNAPEDYSSGNIAGNNCETFNALAIIPGGSYQAEGSWTKDPALLKYTVDWMEFGSLRLSKVDNTSNFQKGSKFRLISTSYDGFDETYEVTQDADGDYELLIEDLPVGTYSLTEIDCDDYFAPTVAQWTVTIEKDKTTKQIVVNTLRPTGNLTVQKTLESANAGATNVADDDITKTSYKIVVSDDIKDTVSLKDLYKKGETITLGSGKCVIDASGEELEFSKGVQLVKGTDNGDGTFSVDENGQLELSGIPLGKYKVVETSCPDGYVLDETEHEIKFVQEDYTTTVYTQSVEQTNKITKTEISKTKVTGEEELAGASLKVTDEKGNVIDEWTSSNQPHEIDGLTAGKTYTLHEDLAPLGYVKATSVDFTVNNDGEVQQVQMKDKVVKISKQDIGGDEIEGALIQIIDEDGNVIDEWTSSNQPHYAENLEEGKTYTLHEDLAPNGYNIANDFEFTVTEEKEDQTVEMIDTVSLVAKTDENDQYVKGAKLEVVSTKTKNIIDRWTSGQHIIDIDEDMKTALLNKETVTGTIEEDEKEITYSIKDNDGDYIVMMKDDMGVSYYTVDIDGNETTHMIQGLVAGEEYILREIEAPKGYATAEEQTFTAGEDEDTTLKMVDQITKIVLHKQDITTKEELAGAQMKVTDEDGNVIDEWTSTTEAHVIQGLEVGKTYTMTEVIAPKNYKTAESVTFTVTDTGVEQHVYMYDELMPVAKKVKTGDNSNIMSYAFFGLISLIGLLKTRKQEDKE